MVQFKNHKLLIKLQHSAVHIRVVIICVCFMFFSMMVIGGYLSAVMYQKSYDATFQKMKILTEKTIQNIDQSFSFISNTALAVSTGGSVGAWIDDNNLFDKDNQAYYTNVNKLRDEIKYVLTYSNAWKSDYISYICVFVNGELLLYTYSKPIPESVIIKSAELAYEQVKENEQEFVQELAPFVDDRNIYHVRTMKRDFTSRNALSVMIATDEQVLQAQYLDARQGTQIQLYLIDPEGNIFSTSNPNDKRKECSEELLEAVRTGESENYICFAKGLSSNSLTLVTLVPRDYIVSEAFHELPFFIIITIVLCFILLVSGFLVSFKSTKFINDLVYGMNRVKAKDYDFKMPHYNNASVDMLSDSFNDMTQAMKTLIHDTYESRIMLQEMELEFIQQQMNPHFLFNILTTIQIRAKMCSDETVYNMLTSLSGLLRATLYSNKNVMTTLEQEIKYVKFYLYLQKQRFLDKLDYKILCHPSLECLKIPRLTIEPIVENCVVHGMEGISGKMSVCIQIWAEEEDLVIAVTDNGSGFDAEKMDLTDNEIGAKDSREKIGLKNTSSRLKKMYGEGYALKISSIPDEGTTIVIRIPENKQKGENQCITL